MDALGLNYRNLHRSLGEIAVAAGLPVLEIYERGATVTIKSNASPVTEADLAAEELILRHLCEAFPGVPVLAEEQVASGVLPECGDTFIAVDPLDGT
jgi:3'(2'), 5'-bisphosphate nucleotidase